MKIAMPDLSHLAVSGSEIAVRATPRAARNAVSLRSGTVRISVTSVPEAGKANAMVQKLLAKALGLPKTRLCLIRGATSRDKVFRVE